MMSDSRTRPARLPQGQRQPRQRGYILRRVMLAAALVGAIGLWLGVGAPAYQSTTDTDEKQIRQAAFRYYAGMVLGDESMCIGAVKFPMYSVRNGTGKLVDEKSLRAVTAEVNRRRATANLTEEERKNIATNILMVFDEAAIQFIGGDTASVVFVVRPARSPQVGDVLAQLVLYRSAGKWRVIAEFTDSKPTPALGEDVPDSASGSLKQRP